MRLAAPVLATISVAAMLLALEGAARLRVSGEERAQLPHVGADGETQRRLAWAERDHASDGASWQFDVPDPLLGWRPRPGVHARSVHPGSYDVMNTIDAQGLRGVRDVAREKTPGVTRIAVFGCSQTFGSGVADDETFSARLEAGLPGVEVLNFGVHGYGTDQMLLRYEHEGEAYAPDVVVLAFAYYHLDRNVTGFRFFSKPYFLLEPGGTLRLMGVPVPAPDALARDGGPSAPWPLLDHSVLARWLWERELHRRDEALYYEGTPAWDVTRAVIARFAAEAHGQGARMILLNIDEDAPWLTEPLTRLAGEVGIDWADAGPRLGVLRGQGVRLRLPRDPHWNPQGHAVIADVLRARLCTPPALAGCGG
jgi:hypothetical protein